MDEIRMNACIERGDRVDLRLKFLMLVVLSLASLVCSVGVTSAWAAPVAATDAQVSPKSPQWEYLVVSGGKTYFSSTLMQSAEGESKAILAAGSTFTSEAVAVEAQMDSLGRRGWELVAVVGSIGGDQELVFKRPYVKAVVEAEVAERRAQAEKWAALLKGAGKLTPSEPGAQIVDLDERERMERLARNMAHLQAQVDGALRAVLVSGLKIEKDTLVSPKGELSDEAALSGTLVVDATSQLLGADNTYRSSAARDLAKQIYTGVVQTISPQVSRLFGPRVEVKIRGKVVGSWDEHAEFVESIRGVH